MTKALILVGGFGTRLRPLTLTVPKPLVPFANKAMILHQIEALKEVGVDEVVLAINYRPESMKKEMDQFAEKLGIKITYSLEEEPMGTAGPLALAKSVLTADDNQTFFVLNSDIICKFPFKDLLEFHKKHGKEGTIMVTKVSEPSKYGVVVSDKETGEIQRFVEKPQVYVGNRINAGIYIFNKSILDRIEMRPTSIEREIFPAMAKDKELYAMDLEDFWMDIGQPKDYLIGMCMYLNYLKENNKDENENVKNRVMIHETAKIGKDCVIGPNVIIGPNVVIGDGCRIERTTIFEKSTVGNYSYIKDSIIGWGSTLGKWSRVDNHSVIGADVFIKPTIYINGGIILPNKEIGEDVLVPGTIKM